MYESRQTFLPLLFYFALDDDGRCVLITLSPRSIATAYFTIPTPDDDGWLQPSRQVRYYLEECGERSEEEFHCACVRRGGVEVCTAPVEGLADPSVYTPRPAGPPAARRPPAAVRPSITAYVLLCVCLFVRHHLLDDLTHSKIK